MLLRLLLHHSQPTTRLAASAASSSSLLLAAAAAATRSGHLQKNYLRLLQPSLFYHCQFGTSPRRLSTQTTTSIPPTLSDGAGNDNGSNDDKREWGDDDLLISTDDDGRVGGEMEEADEDDWSDDGWEEEEEDADPEFGDGGDGGGVLLRGVDWGERALSIANEVLDLHFDKNDMKIFAFKVSPKGYIYVRLDKLSDKYGCPGMDEIEHFNRLYGERLEESGKRGEIPDNLAIEVSSPGAARLLKVPDDLERFKDIPVVVQYSEEDVESKLLHQEGVFFLDSIDTGAGHCTWKLADVKENRDPLGKGRPLSKQKKEWRLTLPFSTIKRATFYLSF